MTKNLKPMLNMNEYKKSSKEEDQTQALNKHKEDKQV